MSFTEKLSGNEDIPSIAIGILTELSQQREEQGLQADAFTVNAFMKSVSLGDAETTQRAIELILEADQRYEALNDGNSPKVRMIHFEPESESDSHTLIMRKPVNPEKSLLSQTEGPFPIVQFQSIISSIGSQAQVRA